MATAPPVSFLRNRHFAPIRQLPRGKDGWTDVEFYDQFDHTIDDKGRLVLPAAYRTGFTGGGFVTFLGKYAGLFTPGDWDRYRRRLADSGTFSRNDLQVIFSLASPFTPDAQHRFSLSNALRERVNLDREVTLVGSAGHVAIYDRSTWRAINADVESGGTDGITLVDKIDSLGFL